MPFPVLFSTAELIDLCRQIWNTLIDKCNKAEENALRCCKNDKYKWCASVPLVDYRDGEGNAYCVFHAPKGKKGISSDEFIKRVRQRIQAETRVHSKCDLSGTNFEGILFLTDGYGLERGKELFLNESLFNDEFRIQNCKNIGTISFSDATFLSIVTIKNVEIHEHLDLSGVSFNDYFKIVDSVFHESFGFLMAKLADLYIIGSTFHDGMTIHETSLTGTIGLLDSTFIKVSSFHDCSFNEARVSGCTFDTLKFLDTTVNQDAAFLDLMLNGLSGFWGNTFLGEARFEHIIIKERLQFHSVDLGKAVFWDTDMRNINFVNSQWPTSHGRTILYDEILLASQQREVDKSIFEDREYKLSTRIYRKLGSISPKFSMTFFSGADIQKVENKYRLLKQKYKEEHNEIEASNWHYGEKEMQRKCSLFQRFFPLSPLNLYWLFSGYGERPFRAAISLLIFIISLAVFLGLEGVEDKSMNAAMQLTLSGEQVDWVSLGKLILGTLQFALFDRSPDFIPITLAGKFLKVLAQVLIPVQAAFFVFALRNKYRR